MRAARSRATIHVPINEAQQGEEPERIGGLVFKGRDERKKAAEEKSEMRKSETKVAKIAKSAKRRPMRHDATRRDDAKSATRPRE